MVHEVYICYSSKDKVTADAICHTLEENKFKCWIKPRDVGVRHIAEEITDAIRASKIMVLVFSENAKQSNYVNTEVDIAFSSNIPILVFKIDDANLDGGLEFFLENKHWLDAYPNPGHEFRNLVIDVAKLLEKPIEDPIINKKTIKTVNNIKYDYTSGLENNAEADNRTKTFIKAIAGTCIVPLILAFLGAMFMEEKINHDVGYALIVIGFFIFILFPIYFIGKWLYNRN
ncbi:toll/interleukin-1 receptor domain-containing protein [uncultured Methanobrevibacter sp.]|uniref:toll/interleukin-1 receptor domain-containing protein n=1 Tax=uncultured Methanobrevibacter sp. TaxID=253161 RepID=UPI00262078E0|nr:toll/interleukin-1 receptor domain-containing protein [uncultured Methanobrevibacter sp.]